MSLITFAFIQSLLFTLALSQGTCKDESGVELTFYGYPDGSSDTVSFSCGSNGGKAGGTGSYSNPETFATAQSNTDFTNCDIVYIPYLQKYFQYSDHCVKCDQDFTSGGLVHLDLWIGNSVNGGQAQILCEDTFGSVSGQTIIRNPPSNLPVNSGALWDGSACHDASSSNPFVFPNPSTSGLCSGGGSSSPPSGGSSSASVAPAPTSTPSVTPSPPPLAPSTTAQSVTPVTITPSVTPPTTLLTFVTPSSSSVVSTSTTAPSTNNPNTSDCASWGGCLGDPCKTYDDCAGDWICMGTPKVCTNNLKD